MAESASLPAVDAVEPFFFGPRDNQLFGCYHEPPAWPAREVGVVICYPHGQEYIRSHRACHHLAVQSARSGFPTLRFDYAGTGDSAGDASHASLANWHADLRLAVAELRARSGVGPVVLAGLRLGATLALLAAPAAADLAGLVLWEPVSNGPHYLEELRALHEEAIRRFFVEPTDHVLTARPAELVGFALSETMRTEIEGIDLLQAPPPRGKPLLLLESQGSPELAALAAHLKPARLTHQVIPSFTVWVEDVDKGLVPQPLIEAITGWLDKEFA